MHILFLAPASSVHSYRWIKYFSEIQGIKITWCSFAENTMPKLDKVELKILRKNTPIELLRSFQYISKKSADIIHVHYMGWNGFLSIFFPKTPVISTAWGSDIVFNSRNFLKKWLLKKMIRLSNIITCDAYHLKDRLMDLGCEQEKIELIMFGVDESSFITTRRPFDIKKPKTKFMVGSIRNLYPVYDVITFVKAAKIVLDQRNDVTFIVASSGSDLNSLEEFVDKNKITEGVKFLGRVEQSQLVNFYDDLDVYVSTALSDGGLASSTQEAMICKRPVVITDCAENSYWVKDHVNGRLFDCGDFSSLAKIILELLENKEIGRNLGLKAKETIILRSSYNNEMSKMLKIYQKTAENTD